jgi:hypothetical protein
MYPAVVASPTLSAADPAARRWSTAAIDARPSSIAIAARRSW